MPNPYGVSDAEFNLIKQQAAKRANLRKEFIKQKTNPFKHASEAGYVFDPAIQKFLSMKVTQLEYFQANTRTSLFGVCAIFIPMFTYGYVLWKHRTTREEQIRKGELRYKDRLFKLA
ncbi:NADH dehydrogenase (ubiquinone) B15 subunit [Anticarsia gemmatalis]|uniref:NADH dehydrogenase (ubiquinone) B15 subunit n=1 Tax=Anticarsia gemmatalis TaxID=129554 RepID=UPI003F773A43